MSDPKSQALDARVDDLLAQLALDEKVRLLAGASAFALHGVERLGIPAISMTDGPTGVRSIRGQPATVFPVGVAVAASWNVETAASVAAATGREARAMGEQVVLAPTVNIMRTPTWGRTFETYSEDPYLAGVIGSAYVRGLQGEGVGASLKHYAANNQELERFRVDARVDERTLREIYLAAFERVVREADPWTVMASYNKLNGTYASEHRRLLTDILKTEWGYEGLVVSDWTAVRSTAPAANAGLDLEMPGPAKWFGDKLLAAAEAGEVSPAQIDDNARRVLRLIVRSERAHVDPPAGERLTPRHRAVAFEAACDGMVLLKNEGELLPLSPSLGTVAVIGPNAVRCMLQGGGSSQVATDADTSVTAAVRRRLGPGATVFEAQGADNDAVPPPAVRGQFSPSEAREAEGLSAAYFATGDLSGEPNSTGIERHMVRWVSGAIASARRPAYGAFRWTGWFWPEATGTYEFSVRATGGASLWLDGELLVAPDMPASADRLDVMGVLTPRRLARIELEAGRGYPIRMDYRPADPDQDYVAIGVRPPPPSIADAVAAAAQADAVVLVLGSGSATEAEGYDRENLDLPGAQDDLARAVLAANPRTVVVLNTGSPFAMPWIADAPAVLQLWLPGEAGPDALAAVLFGERAPGGRLPVTFPRAFGDHPAHAPGPDPLVCVYGEGLGVGYRWFDANPVRPLFPFGHGLAYTTFEISDLTAPTSVAVGQAVRIEVEVANTGDRAGQEVVQAYVAALDSTVARPPKELKAFAKVALDPGERRRVALDLEPGAFAYWDVGGGGWRIDPGAYDILVGRSSGDIRAKATLTITSSEA